MTFFLSTIKLICLLVAMLMMCSVSGRGSDNLREAAETEPTMDDNTNNVRRQETTVCGRRQIPTWKRDEGKGGSNDINHSDHLDKILRGSDVTYGYVPWHVHIYRDGRRICGGVIISEFWIITAASCVNFRHHYELELVVGDRRMSHDDERQQTFNVQRRVFHPSYSEVSVDYDIALIKVEQKHGSGIRFTNYIQPICLPVAGEILTDNDNLIMVGRESYLTETINLYTAIHPTHVLPVFNNTRCLDNFSPGLAIDKILCVGRFIGDYEKCIFNYGGPAIYQSGDTYILAGIIISDYYCAPPRTPAFLTNVLVFRDWIHNRINQFSNARQLVIPPRAD